MNGPEAAVVDGMNRHQARKCPIRVTAPKATKERRIPAHRNWRKSPNEVVITGEDSLLFDPVRSVEAEHVPLSVILFSDRQPLRSYEGHIAIDRYSRSE